MTKYRAQRTEVDGIMFDSKKEARRYSELKLLQLAGEISHLELQPEYVCIVDGVKICTYRADFRYICKNTTGPKGQKGATIVEDVKGFKTRDYRIKKKLVEALYRGVIIQEK